jgi:hypothetical protein
MRNTADFGYLSRPVKGIRVFPQARASGRIKEVGCFTLMVD